MGGEGEVWGKRVDENGQNKCWTGEQWVLAQEKEG
jgi:hypothetical protein